MTRNLKALGLALVAALAMSAVVASAASADPTSHTFTAEDAPVTITGNQKTVHEFSTAVGAVECEIAEFHGTSAVTAADKMTITPTYDECEFAEEPATVTMNGCDYRFTSDTTTNSSQQLHARVSLICDTTTTPTHRTHRAEIHVPSTGCTITVPEQETTNGVRYSHEGEGTTTDITLNATAVLHIEVDGPFFPCAFIGNTGTYTGTSTVTGEDEDTGEHIGLEVTTP